MAFKKIVADRSELTDEQKRQLLEIGSLLSLGAIVPSSLRVMQSQLDRLKAQGYTQARLETFNPIDGWLDEFKTEVQKSPQRTPTVADKKASLNDGKVRDRLIKSASEYGIDVKPVEGNLRDSLPDNLRAKLPDVANTRIAGLAFTDPATNRPNILVDAQQSKFAADNTIAHEFGHMTAGHLGSRKNLSPTLKELEADAIAYGVARKIGLAGNPLLKEAYLERYRQHLNISNYDQYRAEIPNMDLARLEQSVGQIIPESIESQRLVRGERSPVYEAYQEFGLKPSASIAEVDAAIAPRLGEVRNNPVMRDRLQTVLSDIQSRGEALPEFSPEMKKYLDATNRRFDELRSQSIIKPEPVARVAKPIPRRALEPTVMESIEGGKRIRSFANLPMGDWDWNDVGHAHAQSITIKDLGDLVENFEDVRPKGDFRFYLTPGGVHAFDVSSRENPTQFFGREDVKALNVDPMYQRFAIGKDVSSPKFGLLPNDEGGLFSVRVSPKLERIAAGQADWVGVPLGKLKYGGATPDNRSLRELAIYHDNYINQFLGKNRSQRVAAGEAIQKQAVNLPKSIARQWGILPEIVPEGLDIQSRGEVLPEVSPRNFGEQLSMFEVPKRKSGLLYLPNYLTIADQKDLLNDLRTVVRQSPLFTPTMSSGAPFKYKMTNIGELGWNSDRKGYRYESRHPVTGQPYPEIPLSLRLMIDDLSGKFGEKINPQAVLLNWYPEGAKLGLHIDNTEKVKKPVVSISLGDRGLFAIDATGSRDRSTAMRNLERINVNSGDAIVFGGDLRDAYHAVERIDAGTAPTELGMKSSGRINLTARQVNPVLDISNSSEILPEIAPKKINDGSITTTESTGKPPKLTSDIIADYLDRMGGQATLVKPDGTQYNPDRKGRVVIGDRMTTAEKFGQANDVGLNNEFTKLPEVHARFDDRRTALQVQKEIATGKLTTQKFFEVPTQEIANQAADEIRRSPEIQLGRGENIEVRKSSGGFEVVATKQYQPIPSRGNTLARTYGLNNDPTGAYVAFNKPEESYSAPKSLKELQAEIRGAYSEFGLRPNASQADLDAAVQPRIGEVKNNPQLRDRLQVVLSDMQNRQVIEPVPAQNSWDISARRSSPMFDQVMDQVKATVDPLPRLNPATDTGGWANAVGEPYEVQQQRTREARLQAEAEANARYGVKPEPKFAAEMGLAVDPNGLTDRGYYNKVSATYADDNFGLGDRLKPFPDFYDLLRQAKAEGVRPEAFQNYIKGRANAPLIEAGIMAKPELPMTARLGQEYISPKTGKVATIEAVGRTGVKMSVDGQPLRIEGSARPDVIPYQTLERLKYTGNKQYGFVGSARSGAIAQDSALKGGTRGLITYEDFSGKSKAELNLRGAASYPVMNQMLFGSTLGLVGYATAKGLAKKFGLNEDQQEIAGRAGGALGAVTGYIGGTELAYKAAGVTVKLDPRLTTPIKSWDDLQKTALSLVRDEVRRQVGLPPMGETGATIPRSPETGAIFSARDRASILNNKLPQYDIKPVLSEAAVIATDMLSPSPYGIATVPAMRTTTELWQQNFNDVAEKGIAGLVNRTNVTEAIAKTKSLKDLTYQSLTAIAKGAGLPFPMTEQIVGNVVDRVPSGQEVMDMADRAKARLAKRFGLVNSEAGAIYSARGGNEVNDGVNSAIAREQTELDAMGRRSQSPTLSELTGDRELTREEFAKKFPDKLEPIAEINPRQSTGAIFEPEPKSSNAPRTLAELQQKAAEFNQQYELGAIPKQTYSGKRAPVAVMSPEQAAANMGMTLQEYRESQAAIEKAFPPKQAPVSAGSKKPPKYVEPARFATDPKTGDRYDMQSYREANKEWRRTLDAETAPLRQAYDDAVRAGDREMQSAITSAIAETEARLPKAPAKADFIAPLEKPVKIGDRKAFNMGAMSEDAIQARRSARVQDNAPVTGYERKFGILNEQTGEIVKPKASGGGFGKAKSAIQNIGEVILDTLYRPSARSPQIQPKQGNFIPEASVEAAAKSTGATASQVKAQIANQRASGQAPDLNLATEAAKPREVNRLYNVAETATAKPVPSSAWENAPAWRSPTTVQAFEGSNAAFLRNISQPNLSIPDAPIRQAETNRLWTPSEVKGESRSLPANTIQAFEGSNAAFMRNIALAKLTDAPDIPLPARLSVPEPKVNTNLWRSVNAPITGRTGKIGDRALKTFGVAADATQAAQAFTQSVGRGESGQLATTRAAGAVGAYYLGSSAVGATASLYSLSSLSKLAPLPAPFKAGLMLAGGIASAMGADEVISNVVGVDKARQDKYQKDMSRLGLSVNSESEMYQPFGKAEPDRQTNNFAKTGEYVRGAANLAVDSTIGLPEKIGKGVGRSLAELTERKSIDTARYLGDRSDSIQAGYQAKSNRSLSEQDESGTSIIRSKGYTRTESRILALQNLANEHGYEIARNGKYSPKLNEALEKLGYSDQQVGDFITGKTAVIGKPPAPKSNQQQAKEQFAMRANLDKKPTSAELSQALSVERKQQGLKYGEMLSDSAVAGVYSGLSSGAGRTLSELRGKTVGGAKTQSALRLGVGIR